MDPIIYGLSNGQYHFGEKEREYLSSSQLKNYSRSPKFAKFMLDNPQPQTEAMRFGSLFHDLMASCAEHYDNGTQAIGEWMSRIAVFESPKNDKTGQPYGVTTKAYREAYEAFLLSNGSKTIASQTDLIQVQQMAQSLLFDCGSTSEQVRKLLKRAKATEVSYFYETEDGIKLKIRPDLLTKRTELIDWKTCALDSLDEESIARQIIKYRYDVSLSMYQFVLHKITGKWYKPMLIFVTKSAPYDAMIADISEWCYDYDKSEDIVSPGIGALEFQRLLALHTKCTKENLWPGAESALPEDNKAIMKPSVPVWFGRKYYEE